MKQILIVDDALELGRVLKAALKTIDSTLEITVVPSAEEALFVVGKKRLDLLVADVRLPGISGLELVGRMRKLQPDLKVVVISGLKEASLEQQVAEYAVNAFLRKPMQMDQFLETSMTLLGHELEDVPVVEREPETSTEIASLLFNLAETISASCALLLDSNGEKIISVGEIPFPIADPAWAAAIQAYVKTTKSLFHFDIDQQAGIPFYLHGRKGVYDFLLSQYGDFTIILTGPAGRLNFQNNEIISVLLTVFEKIESFFNQIDSQLLSVPGPDVLSKKADSHTGNDEDLQSLFEKPIGQFNSQDVQMFWESAINTSDQISGSPDFLSYEEAQKLGLTPENDEEKAIK